MAVKVLYDVDFFEWAQQKPELLRKGLSEIDVENLAALWPERQIQLAQQHCSFALA